MIHIINAFCIITGKTLDFGWVKTSVSLKTIVDRFISLIYVFLYLCHHSPATARSFCLCVQMIAENLNVFVWEQTWLSVCEQTWLSLCGKKPDCLCVGGNVIVFVWEQIWLSLCGRKPNSLCVGKTWLSLNGRKPDCLCVRGNLIVFLWEETWFSLYVSKSNCLSVGGNLTTMRTPIYQTWWPDDYLTFRWWVTNQDHITTVPVELRFTKECQDRQLKRKQTFPSKSEVLVKFV